MAIVLNDLYDYDLKIYQDEDKFKFSLDSLLLAEFVKKNKKDRQLLDLCTGNAPLPMILKRKFPSLNIIGIEIQKSIYELGLKSIFYNKEDIELLNMNAKEAIHYFPGNKFDIITCNPPYFKVSKESLTNPDQTKAIARHEIEITLEEIFEIASFLLKNQGKFYLVHRPVRLEEMIELALKYNLHVKEIQFVYTRLEDCAIMVLLKFVKNANTGVKVYSKIINRETKTYKNIFDREK